MSDQPQHQPQPIDPRIIQIANDTVAHINSGAASDMPLWDKHWHPDFVSVEGDGMEFKGRKAVEDKHAWWFNTFTVHSCKAQGPFVGKNCFALHLTMDIEAKDGSMPRMTMQEIASYEVNDGKVTRELFLGAPQNC
jgi:hypothetical protein